MTSDRYVTRHTWYNGREFVIRMNHDVRITLVWAVTAKGYIPEMPHVFRGVLMGRREF